MAAELMQWEQDVIINSMTRKSSKEIAAILGTDEKKVADFICANCGAVTTKDQLNAERKALRPNKPVAVKKKKEVKERITSARIDTNVLKRPQRQYKTIHVNMNALIPVKIDHKTYIYIKPGVDIEKAKSNFLKSINASLDYHKNRNTKK